jgi:hypothetical protein
VLVVFAKQKGFLTLPVKDDSLADKNPENNIHIKCWFLFAENFTQSHIQ